MDYEGESYTSDTYVYSYQNRLDVTYCWPELRAQAETSEDEKHLEQRSPMSVAEQGRIASETAWKQASMLPTLCDPDETLASHLDVLVFTLGMKERGAIFKFIVD